jgi:hypothetical protein
MTEQKKTRQTMEDLPEAAHELTEEEAEAVQGGAAFDAFLEVEGVRSPATRPRQSVVSDEDIWATDR